MVKGHFKFLFGVLLQIAARVIALMAFVLKGRHSYLEESGYNITLQCIFNKEQGASILMVNSKLMLTPSILNCLSVAIAICSPARDIVPWGNGIANQF